MNTSLNRIKTPLTGGKSKTGYRRRIDLLFLRTISAVAIIFCISPSSAAHSQTPTDSLPLAKIRVSKKGGQAIPNNFMGLSHEWGTTMPMFGYSTTGVNTVYRQLLANLTAYGSDPIQLRIGGNSTDSTGRSTGDRMAPLAELSKAVHSRFILGVNLGSSDVELAKNQVEFYLDHMPKGSVEAIEIGNEPDHYIKRRMRPDGYGLNGYLKEFDSWKAAILPLLPKGMLLVGPSWGATGETVPMTTAFIEKESGSVGVVSVHFYAESPYSKHPPDFLLKPNSSTSALKLLTPAVLAAHERHIPVRVAELNSFYGVGLHGLSDAFSAALWSIDTMFEYANAGVDGVNWEADGSNFCSPFIFTRTTSGQTNSYELKAATPLYYGMIFFQASVGRGAKLLPVEVDTKANVKVWATEDERGAIRLAIINKDEVAQGPVIFQMPGYSRATVSRLIAPSYTSLDSVTFAGRTLDGSVDGKLPSAEKTESFTAVNGSFAIPLTTTSAALVTFSR